MLISFQTRFEASIHIEKEQKIKGHSFVSTVNLIGKRDLTDKELKEMSTLVDYLDHSSISQKGTFYNDFNTQHSERYVSVSFEVGESVCAKVIFLLIDSYLNDMGLKDEFQLYSVEVDNSEKYKTTVYYEDFEGKTNVHDVVEFSDLTEST